MNFILFWKKEIKTGIIFYIIKLVSHIRFLAFD